MTLIETSNYIQTEFDTGPVYTTPGVRRKVTMGEVYAAVQCHSRGDWGDIDRDDQSQNDGALKYGGRLCSRYSSSLGVTYWIITEADRSRTTVLLPMEY